MEKYQIKVISTTINVDHLGFEYSQLDGDDAGRSENGTMHRDVIGMQSKIYCGFDYKKGSELKTLLNISRLKSANVTYIDPRVGETTKNMYVVSDKIEVLLLNGEYVAEPFEMRFIQMDVDSL